MTIEITLPGPAAAVFETAQPPDGVTVSLEQEFANIDDGRFVRSVPEIVVVIVFGKPIVSAVLKWIWKQIADGPGESATVNRIKIDLKLPNARLKFEREIRNMIAEDGDENDAVEE